jgi:hypothetical protein
VRAASARISIDELGDTEQRTYLGHRWWAAEDLRQTGETYFPQELAEIVMRLRGGPGDGEGAVTP